MENQQDGDWYWEQQCLGFNYRLTGLQAALGLSQFKRIDDFIKRRHELVVRYNMAFKDLPIVLPHMAQDCYSAWHLYVIQTKNRKQIFDVLKQHGIGVMVHYIPVYLHPFYQKLGFKKGYCLNAEGYYAHALTIPLYSALSYEQQDCVINLLKVLI
jgi:perosamine synthetase